MRRQRITSQSGVLALAQAVLLVGSGLLGGTAWAAPEYTTQFPLEQCTFVAEGRNLHFTRKPPKHHRRRPRVPAPG